MLTHRPSLRNTDAFFKSNLDQSIFCAKQKISPKHIATAVETISGLVEMCVSLQFQHIVTVVDCRHRCTVIHFVASLVSR
jgi:hypothetical protein